MALLLPIFHVFSRSRGPAPSGGSSPGPGGRRGGASVPASHPGIGSPRSRRRIGYELLPHGSGFAALPSKPGQAGQGRCLALPWLVVSLATGVKESRILFFFIVSQRDFSAFFLKKKLI